MASEVEVGVASADGPSPRLSSLERVPHPCGEPLHLIVTTATVVTLPRSKEFLYDGPLLGSATYRHREKPFSMRFSEWRASRDACNSSLRAYSR